MIEFFVAGTPVTQGSKTAIVRGGRPILVEKHTDKARGGFVAWRHAVASEARRAAGGDEDQDTGDDWPQPGPVIVTLSFGLQMPASAPKRRRVWPIGARSGDVDKLARACLDAITGVLIGDDAQVVGLSVTKAYGRPGVRIQMWSEKEEQRWVPEWNLNAVQSEQGLLTAVQ